MAQPSFLDSVKTVLAGLFGVRRRADHDAQSARINPLHVIIASVMVAVLFVLTLVTVVRLVLS